MTLPSGVASPASGRRDFMPLNGVDHLELYDAFSWNEAEDPQPTRVTW